MTYEEAEAYVHSFPRFGSQLSLNRMRRLMSLLGDPQEQLRFVHIAGTNGKGTTARLTASVLQEAGYRTGLYTSPFVLEFRERYQINGEMIPKNDLAALVDEIAPLVRRMAASGDNVTEFEMVTALGFTWFARNRCDLVALEVGLGGRLDATNVIPTPECAVITSISMDHTAILGDSLEKIAFEKAGIMKPGSDVVTYALQAPEALGVFYERCAETGSRLIQPNPRSVEIHECGPLGSRFSYDGSPYELRFPGRHQVYNALSVIEAAKVLRQKGYRISGGQLAEGIRRASLPARFEILSRRPLIILDGAHNRQSAEALAETLAGLGSCPKAAVVGMMRDKDCRRFLEALSRQCAVLFTVPIPGVPRASSPEELAELARPFFEQVESTRHQEQALALAVEAAGEAGAVVICGSFYLASQLRPAVQRKFPF